MRILITGAAGFIGSHLAELLLGQEHEVVGVDNFITGSPRTIAQLQAHPRFTFVEANVIEPLALDGPLDRIYHLASPSSPVAYASHRIATLKVNSLGTCNLLDLADQKQARFLMASTSEIYGDPLISPQREEHWGNVNSIGLRSMYEEAKRFSEAAAMAYQRERQADTRIVRIFNTYGPRMSANDGRVVPSFVQRVLGNEPIVIYGDGTQARSFCYVSDIVRGIALAMEADFHEPINLGNPEEVSILQLARHILELMPGTRSRIAFESGPAYDPRVRRPDISRARQILAWSPQIALVEGLGRVIDYFRNGR